MQLLCLPRFPQLLNIIKCLSIDLNLDQLAKLFQFGWKLFLDHVDELFKILTLGTYDGVDQAVEGAKELILFLDLLELIVVEVDLSYYQAIAVNQVNGRSCPICKLTVRLYTGLDLQLLL